MLLEFGFILSVFLTNTLLTRDWLMILERRKHTASNPLLGHVKTKMWKMEIDKRSEGPIREISSETTSCRGLVNINDKKQRVRTTRPLNKTLELKHTVSYNYLPKCKVFYSFKKLKHMCLLSTSLVPITDTVTYRKFRNNISRFISQWEFRGY